MDPDASEDDTNQITERIAGLVDEYGGRTIKTEKWGTKKLAYTVKKRDKGCYFLLRYSGDLRLTTELERILKLDDKILKLITLKVGKDSEPSIIEEPEPEKEEEQSPAETIQDEDDEQND